MCILIVIIFPNWVCNNNELYFSFTILLFRQLNFLENLFIFDKNNPHILGQED